MKDNEYVCYECKGTGRINHFEESKWFYECIIKCPLCKGTGKLDWISNIIKPKDDGVLEIDISVAPIEIIELNLIVDNKNRTKKE